MNIGNPTEEDHHARSSFVRQLVQCPSDIAVASSVFDGKLPKRIVQFWDDLDQLPGDVGECIETWRKTEEQGVERLLFDKRQARDFIYRKLGLRHKQAYDKCYHPAMQSDYFRLCYILVEGGCYIDADDVYNGSQIQHLFSDGRLKIQPLCYDTATNMMVPPSLFTKLGANAASWIFYFNNNPLIACSGHPLMARALDQATLSLEQDMTNGLPEIQSTTGPGNLTKSIFDAVTESGEIEQTLLVLCDWENIARNRWDLNYRNDPRNWRLSNCQGYRTRMMCQEYAWGDE
jgi:mannosyltransferase OCH1-like enzyme